MITEPFNMRVTLDDRKVSTNNFDLGMAQMAQESNNSLPIPFFNALDRTLSEHGVDTEFFLYSLEPELGAILIEEYDMESREVFFWLAEMPPTVAKQGLSKMMDYGVFLKFGELS